ncbi:MAG: PpiC-type peptidyl-prolyl cis-trans isomerase [Fibrobacteres bacterium]|nr:PpiC-type peptidyl-prolyl cis-trans isomerase [Fibrobacterota bacterium]
MTLEWMKKQAKWVIGIFGLFILGGLVMMDRAGSYRSDRHHNIVGKVNGEEIPTDRFQSELKNYLRGQEAQNGKAPEGLQLAQIREGLFNFKVQSVLMQKIFDGYQLHASREEMMDYVVKHPQEVAGHIARYKGYEEMPPFLADSSIDQARFENWLAQDSIYDRYSMQELEQQLKTSVIPQVQLQQIMKSQIHRTPLEEAFTVSMRENKARVKFYHVPADSFSVSPDKFKDADLKAYYEAHPDSFYFHDEAARLAYVRLPLRPSRTDSALMAEFAKELKERVANGEKFADLAKDYSNDPGSAEKGGKLEGLRGREGLDPAFANAAFALKPGEISDPVLSQFGYHIILLHDRKKVDSTEKVEVSHILLKVTPGTETIDSLMGQAEKIRASAQKDGLEKAAKEFNITLEKTPIFEKSNLSPLGGGYVQGANSFAFSKFEAKEEISEALQSDDGIYLFEREAKFDKGRNFERAKPQIAADLAKEEKLNLAKKELEAQKSAIAAAPEGALPPHIGKAVLDSTAAGPISADNWLSGFGYSSPVLFQVFNQPVGSWGPVLTTDIGAVLAKVTEKVPVPGTELANKVQAQLMQADPYAVSGIYQDFVTNLPKSAKVENTMDLVFRN